MRVIFASTNATALIVSIFSALSRVVQKILACQGANQNIENCVETRVTKHITRAVSQRCQWQ